MWGRLGPRFALEALFLILLAVALGIADLSTTTIVGVMAAGWLLVSLIELVASRQPRFPARVERVVVEEPAALPEPMPLEEPARAPVSVAEPAVAAEPEQAPAAPAEPPLEPAPTAGAEELREPVPRRRWFRRREPPVTTEAPAEAVADETEPPAEIQPTAESAPPAETAPAAEDVRLDEPAPGPRRRWFRRREHEPERDEDTGVEEALPPRHVRRIEREDDAAAPPEAGDLAAAADDADVAAEAERERQAG